MIPHEVIEEIKYRNDIEEVISQYVVLKRAGSNLNGLCPFHSEKTPSFTVFKATNSYYCFGCGSGGDVITFIMKVENLDYVGALEFLAKRVGITIPESGKDEQTGVKRSRILEMNREAAKFFHGQLKNSPEALEYMSKRRLSGATIKHFGLGYAPKEFGALTSHMRSLGFSAEELKEAFLCGISQKTGKPYDYFRGRVMFPIINTTGDVVGFGGRVLDDSKPKYLNTNDTAAFKKSKNLFGLNFAKDSCSERMILCEGNVDVISLHAAGFTNAVATLGTALTAEQARLMKKYTKTVLICYDSDEAGQKAANKAFAVLGEVGLETRILKLEGAKDPDEYINKFGKIAFQKVIDGSYTRFEYKFEGILKRYDIERTDEKIKAAAATAEEISRIASNVERDIYISKAAARLDIPRDSLKRDVERTLYRNRKKDTSEKKQKLIMESQGYGDRVTPERVRNLKGVVAEENILGIMLRFPEYSKGIRTGKFELSRDDFVSEFAKRVFEAIISAGDDFEIGALNEKFSEAEMSRIIKLQVARETLSVSDKAFRDSVASLKQAVSKETMSLEDIIKNKRNNNKGSQG